ncbi:MAG: anaerobic ribonucleoside-triphosphate reductase, partial [Dysosmobacter sp.]|nr:anaerobic ribonucleoside-triphosphate reductase [Dysosmobacter sp.]
IQDLVEYQIMAHGAFEVAKNYVTYRYTRSLVRRSNTTDEKILSLIECCNEEAKQENSNKNPVVNSTQRDYMAGEVSRDITERILLPLDIVEAHREGILHFHDADYFAQHMHNCDLVNLEDMLQNGTVITGTLIERPHSFSTACNIATQIIAQVASNQYGGQSISLTHLAPFVDVSRKKIRKLVEAEMEAIGAQPGEEVLSKLVENRLRDEIKKGVQTIQYQVVTLLTTNGQAPFITVFMYLNEARNQQEKDDLALIIEEMLLQRYEGVKNEEGVWVTPAFPKLIYVLEDDNITEDAPYWYLTELAAKCTARRMVPDYISEKKMRELKGDVYTCMGCRSFLTPDRFTDAGIGNIANAGNYEPGKHKYYGRFNQGVVTINLPDVALSSGGDLGKFWRIFDERLELCHRALQCRHERLKGTPSDVAPILWQYGALARLKKGEVIDKLLYNGYSTISLGYAGLYECVKYMTGKSHTDPSATPFALSVMQKMNDKCKEWKEAENIDYSLYGTPLESTTYKFAKCLQHRFGVIEGITDKGYITNSYHVHVTEAINAFDKLKFEAQFQHLSPGGAISYVEVPDMQDNLPAVLEVMKFIYDNIIYAELNTKSDFCQVCGWDGEIQIVEEHGKLIWKCPKCGNTDQDKMNVARRTCGYIGTQFWNQGRTQEIRDRVLHL